MKFFREPLLHFLLIGAGIFLFYYAQNDSRVVDKHIVINEAQIDHLVTLWEKKRQRLPTSAELTSMIQQQIREEVMYREALAMKLDRNDSIIRRRLAQKIEFISSDLAALAEPTEAQLTHYFETNANKFKLPARIKFTQIFIDPAQHGGNAKEFADNLLAKLKDVNADNDITTLGDSLMLAQQYDQVTEFEVSRLFGQEFSKELFTLPVGNWQGPVASGYGWHLIQIISRTKPLLPELKSVRTRVINEWRSDQQRIMDEAFYESLLEQYEVDIERPATSVTPAGSEK